MNDQTVTLDVREDIRAGREPFLRIMQIVGQLQAGQALRLIAPFQPVPLFAVLARQGFVHQATSLTDGDWEVCFSRPNSTAGSTATAAETSAKGVASGLRPEESGHRPDATASAKDTLPRSPATLADTAKQGTELVDVDARGLEPPEPLVTILDTLSALPDGATLRAHTDRRPMHLYAQLAERGFTGESEEQSDGSFITDIRRS